MLSSFPLIGGLGLVDHDELLIDYWLSPETEIERHEDTPAPDRLLDGRLRWIRRLNLSEAASFAEWGYPLLLVRSSPHPFVQKDAASANSSGADDKFYDTLYNMGISALWELPEAGSPVSFPAYRLPSYQGLLFCTTDDTVLSRHYRQIASFAGWDVRSDFRDADELLGILFESWKKTQASKKIRRRVADASQKQASPQLRADLGEFPRLLLVDLDSSKIDALGLFSGLEAMAAKDWEFRESLELLVTKDFSRPGLDIRQIDRTLRPWARKIFHPEESLTLLLEGLHLHQASNVKPSGSGLHREPLFSASVSTGQSKFHSLKELLHFETAAPHLTEPRFLPADETSILQARRIEPFRWLYRYLGQRRFRGLVLSD